MSVDWLFLNQFDRLTELIRRGPHSYVALQAAAIARQFLLDEQPLMHQVNRDPSRRLDIGFPVCVDALPPDAECERRGYMMSTVGNILGAADPGRVRWLTLDHFLAFRLRYDYPSRRSFTVRDYIKHAANVLGGVHAGRPSDYMDRLLLAEHETTVADGTRSMYLGDVYLICSAMGWGLLPLVEVVRHPDAPPPSRETLARAIVEVAASGDWGGPGAVQLIRPGFVTPGR